MGTNGSDEGSGEEFEEKQTTKEEVKEPGPSKKRKTKRELVPWKDEEKRVAEDFFRTHIKQKRTPKKDEVMKLLTMYPHLFSGRNWATIKVYVQNKYRAIK